MKKFIFVFICMLMFLLTGCNEKIQIEKFNIIPSENIMMNIEEDVTIRIDYNGEEIQVKNIINEFSFIRVNGNSITCLAAGEGKVIVVFEYEDIEYKKDLNIVCYERYDFKILNESIYVTESQGLLIGFGNILIDEFELSTSNEESINVDGKNIIGINCDTTSIITAKFSYNNIEYEINKEIEVKDVEKIENVNIICDDILYEDGLYTIELKTTPEFASCLGTLTVGYYQIQVGKYDKKITLENPIEYYFKDYFENYNLGIHGLPKTANGNEAYIKFESKNHQACNYKKVIIPTDELRLYMSKYDSYNYLIYKDNETSKITTKIYEDEEFSNLNNEYLNILGIIPLWKNTGSYTYVLEDINGEYLVKYFSSNMMTYEEEFSVPDYESYPREEKNGKKTPSLVKYNTVRVKVSLEVLPSLMYIRKENSIDLTKRSDMFLKPKLFEKVDNVYEFEDYPISINVNDQLDLYYLSLNVEFIDIPKYSNLDTDEILLNSIYENIAEINSNFSDLVNEILLIN